MSLSRPELRARVLQEICKTEQAYIADLDLIVEHYVDRMKDNEEISEDDMAFMFSNIQEIRTFQRAFKHDLMSAWRGTNPEGGLACVEDCFVKHAQRFKIYSVYCNNHARSTERLYTLLESPSVRALIKACQLRSMADLSLEAYLLSPVQRICKYPLLLKELLKRSDTEEELAASKRALAAMKEVAEAVNEDKRHMEDLESIDAWQSSVEGWTGPDLRDTSRHLLFKSSVTKYSLSKNKATTNERWFFLFDNMLIYCKKNSTFAQRTSIKRRSSESSIEAKYTFKGRIPTKNLTVLDLEDERAYAQTNGASVSNAIKISNEGKNKWYILECKSPEVKQQWLEAIDGEKSRLENTQDGRIAFWDRSLEKEATTLRQALGSQLQSGQPFIRDRKHRMVTYKACFEGRELIAYLAATKWSGIANPDAALLYCQSLVDGGIIHHVTDKYAFQNDSNFFRFRADDGTYKDKNIIRGLEQHGIQVYRRMHGLESCSVISDHKPTMKTFKNSFYGSDLIDWLIEEGDVHTREEGVVFGTGLLNLGYIHHVTDEHEFKDRNLLYRWTADDDISSKTATVKTRFRILEEDEDHTIHELTITKGEEGFGFIMAGEQPARIRSVDADSAAETVGLTPGLYVLTVDGTDVTGLTHPQVVNAIKACGSSVCLGLQSPSEYNRDASTETDMDPPGQRTREVCSYTYVSRENRRLQVTESLLESPLSFAMPCAILKVFATEDKRQLQCLKSLELSSPRVMQAVEASVMTLSRRVAHYEETAALLAEKARKGVSVKRSVEKTDAAVAFVPTNCHIQKLIVVGDKENPSSYLCVTAGAPAVHNLGFDEGGLNLYGTARPEGYDALQALDLIYRRLVLVDSGLQNVHSSDAVCTRPYRATEEDDLPAMAKGDKLEVLRRNGRAGFCEVRHPASGEVGIVPLSHIEHDESLTDSQCDELATASEILERLAYATKGHIGTRSFNPPLGNEHFCDLETCMTELAGISREDLIMNADVLRASSRRLLTTVNRAVEEASGIVYATSALMQELSRVYRCVDDPATQEPFGLEYRQDVVMSQVLTFLTTGLVATLREELRQMLTARASGHTPASVWFESLCTMGLLAHFESYLSTCGDDRGMVSDFARAVEQLQRVRYQFISRRGQTTYYDVSVTGNRDSITVLVHLDARSFTLLPAALQDGMFVPVTALLFTQGVNEHQTVANQLPGSELQDVINTGSTGRLIEYARRYREHLLDAIATSRLKGRFIDREGLSFREAQIERLQDQLLRALSFTGEKNVNVMALSAELARAMHALRFASCKSGKDRTGMAVTLEQGDLLVRHHGLPPSHFRAAVQLMRSSGVRLLNCFKNIGKLKYAFSQEQVKHLPSLFVPPTEVIGAYTT